MSTFCDSSALVKLYADEGASEVRALSDIVVSALARVEVPAAIWRKHRIGELSVEDAAVLVQAFESDWGDSEAAPRFAIVSITHQILESGARLVARHPLRTLDALQLASALAAQAADPDVTEFVCFDVALAAAARAEGLHVVP